MIVIRYVGRLPRLRIIRPRGYRFLPFDELHRQLNFPAPNFNAPA